MCLAIESMKPAMLLLFAIVVASTVERTEAVSCYQCNYTNYAPLGQSTCTEPFNATSAKKCSAPVCTWQYADYISPQKFKLVYRDCMNDTVFLLRDCEQYGKMSNQSYFIYGDKCCSTTDQTDKDVKMSLSFCFCMTDNCNGDIPYPLSPNSTVAPTTKPNVASLLKPFAWFALLAAMAAMF